MLSRLAPDALVAIERAGRSPDGRYLTMRGRAMLEVEPIDDVFDLAGVSQRGCDVHYSKRVFFTHAAVLS